MQKLGAYSVLALYKDRGLGTGRCEMSFIDTVCSHPGVTHRPDKAEQSFVGGFVQLSVWESCKFSTENEGMLKDCLRKIFMHFLSVYQKNP